MYKTTDETVSIEDWISLNLDRIPSDLIIKALGDEAFEHIQWINRDGLPDGTDDDTDDDTDDEDPEDRELYGGLVPAQTQVYVFTYSDDRPNVRKALDASGFELFEVGGDCPVELFFGIDGGGYNFHGQHWIPFRARRAANILLDKTYSEPKPVRLGILLKLWEAEMKNVGCDLQKACPDVYAWLDGCLDLAEAQTEAVTPST